MLAGTETLAAIANDWLAKLERALAEGDEALLASLFLDDSHWRDLLALTWRITTVSGKDGLTKELAFSAGKAKPRHFKVDPERTPPRYAKRAGTSALEALFGFETGIGRCSGVLR